MFIEQVQREESESSLLGRRGARRASYQEKADTPRIKPPDLRPAPVVQQNSPSKPKKREPKDDESLWMTYLRSNKNRDEEIESEEVHVVLLGEPTTTTSIGKLITGPLHQDQPIGMLLNYSFRGRGSERLGVDMHIWHLNDETHDDLLKCVLPKDAPTVFIVCLDLSRPDLVTLETRKWTTFLRRFSDLYPAEEKPSPSELSFATGEKSEVSSAPAESDAGEEAFKDTLDLPQEDEPPEDPLRPIIFFGTQARRLGSADDVHADDRFLQVTSELRRVSLRNRGSVFVTAKVGNSTVADNLRLHIRSLSKPGQTLDEALNFSTPSLDGLLEQPYFIDAISDSPAKLVSAKPFATAPLPPCSNRSLQKRLAPVTALKDTAFLTFMKGILQGQGTTREKGKPPRVPGGGRLRKKRTAVPQRKPEGPHQTRQQVNEFFEKLLKAKK